MINKILFPKSQRLIKNKVSIKINEKKPTKHLHNPKENS
jgi:hypothetical protein